MEYLPPENQILETALALGLFLAEKNISYTMLDGQNQSASKAVRGLRDFEELYQKVSGTQFSPDVDDRLYLQSVLKQSAINHSKILIGVLQALTMEELVMLTPLLNQGMIMVIYVVTDENIEELIKQGNDRLRIIAVPIDAELKDIL